MEKHGDSGQKLSPMYAQYKSIKEEYPDALLFYRMGDFYELFFDDAPIAARELGLTLTSRNKDDSVPMCGVPWHSAQAYIAQLLEKGYKVAVCDQIEDPRDAKGLVKRAVTRIVTPGTVLDEGFLEDKKANYLGALYCEEEKGAFVWADASTGALTGFQSQKKTELWQMVYKMSPAELLVPSEMEVPSTLKLKPEIQLVRLPGRAYFDAKKNEPRVLAAQKVADLASLGLENKPHLTQALGALIAYLEQTQKKSPEHLAAFRPMDMGKFLSIDDVTERNLELFRKLDGKKGVGTLWHVLDKTITPMGGRLLEAHLRYPFRDVAKIQEHQDVVAFFVGDTSQTGQSGQGGLAVRTAVRQALENVLDIERHSTRLAVDRSSPRDMVALKESLLAFPRIREALLVWNPENLPKTEPAKPAETGEFASPNAPNAPNAYEERGDYLPRALYTLLEQWDDMADVAEYLSSALADSPNTQITEGGIFRYGYNAELDACLDLEEHGLARLEELLAEEQKNSGLTKLRLGYNRVFGYYFELSKAQSASVPAYFERRQSLANAERFSTPALKEMESKILHAVENKKALEYKLFQELREKLSTARPRLLFMASLVALVDYWQALAENAARLGWCRPDVHDGMEIDVTDGRHPVVEAVVGKAAFIPNSIRLDENQRLLLITGPNMAGKSTVLRQTALFCILAQMGSFVPATKARIGLVDRVFSRVGASDNLAAGQSTFMVEMMETARILRQATPKSLVIIDEIGRGTSTFDGLALGWAVLEDLAQKQKCRTLFATHYHELTALEGRIEGVCNRNIAIQEWHGDIVFLRRLVPGPADKSYGVEVARLAGVPQPVVIRAREILSTLEKEKATSPRPLTLPGLVVSSTVSPANTTGVENSKVETRQEVKPPPVLTALRELDPLSLTPLAALQILTEWKILWGTTPEDTK